MLGDDVDAEVLAVPLPTGRAEPGPLVRMLEQVVERRRERRDVVGRHEPRAARTGHLEGRPDRSGDRRDRRRHGLDEHPRHALPARGDAEDIRCCEHLGHVIALAEEPHATLDRTATSGGPHHRGRRARPTDEEERRLATAGGDGFDEHLVALRGLLAAHGDDDELVLAEPELGPDAQPGRGAVVAETQVGPATRYDHDPVGPEAERGDPGLTGGLGHGVEQRRPAAEQEVDRLDRSDLPRCHPAAGQPLDAVRVAHEARHHRHRPAQEGQAGQLAGRPQGGVHQVVGAGELPELAHAAERSRTDPSNRSSRSAGLVRERPVGVLQHRDVDRDVQRGERLEQVDEGALGATPRQRVDDVQDPDRHDVTPSAARTSATTRRSSKSRSASRRPAAPCAARRAGSR